MINLDEERKLFEEWVSSNCGNEYIKLNVGRDTYASIQTCVQWQTWQARAKLSPAIAETETVTIPRAEYENLINLVKHLRPNFGDIGTRDIDVANTQRLFDEAIDKARGVK